MAAFLELESAAYSGAKGRLPARAERFLFGCELSASSTSFTFKVDDDDDSEHILAVQMVCLGEGVKDDYNIVEAVALNHLNKEIAVPIASLKLSCQSMVILENFKVQPPVSFQLKSGCGPVYITGHHLIVHDDDDDDDEEDVEESDYEDVESEDEENIPSI